MIIFHAKCNESIAPVHLLSSDTASNSIFWELYYSQTAQITKDENTDYEHPGVLLIHGQM
jgi:hypothetical protein